MASLEIAERNSRGRRKLSTRIDLTPMVDLGFLLITFFMYTTTMAKPKTMEVNMPYVPDGITSCTTKIPESVALTLILGKDHQVYSYEGISGPNVHVTRSGFTKENGIRQVITAKQKHIETLKKQGATLAAHQLSVLIKPTLQSTYEDLVNVLDEMSINNVKVYAIVDVQPEDIALTERE